jgi:hypothetical protein
MDAAHVEALLVVAVLPEPFQNPVKAAPAGDTLLVYSDEFESFRQLSLEPLVPHPDDPQKITVGGDGDVLYYHHEDVADPVVSCRPGTDEPADHTYRTLSGDARPDTARRDRFPTAQRRQSPRVDDTSRRDVEDCLNSVLQGDATQVLRELPSNAVHGAITSPPYYQVRDYGVDGQLGQEATVEQYVDNLLEVVDLTMRVVRDEGVCWLVIDDVYRDGSLLGIPERLQRGVERSGYNVLHRCPWVKESYKPDPAESRLAHAHETLLCITGSDSPWFSRQDATDERDIIETATGGSGVDHDAVYPAALVAELLEPSIPERVCKACGTPHSPVYEVVDIRDLPSDRPQAQRALELADEHELTDDHLRALRAVGLSGCGQAQRTQDGAGKNADGVESLAAEARDALGSYAREFTNPEKHHTGFEQECACEAGWEPGVVVDPFAGSGTTLAVAKERQRRFLGVELNPDYCETARDRAGISMNNPDALTADAQRGLGEF